MAPRPTAMTQWRPRPASSGRSPPVELSARGLELRAAASLARVWRERGELQAAHQLLAPIVSSFEAALDTPDLREARRMLRELSGEDRRETA